VQASTNTKISFGNTEGIAYFRELLAMRNSIIYVSWALISLAGAAQCGYIADLSMSATWKLLRNVCNLPLLKHAPDTRAYAQCQQRGLHAK